MEEDNAVDFSIANRLASMLMSPDKLDEEQAKQTPKHGDEIETLRRKLEESTEDDQSIVVELQRELITALTKKLASTEQRMSFVSQKREMASREMAHIAFNTTRQRKAEAITMMRMKVTLKP